MEEALILTSGKDAAGMGIIDLRTGSALCSNFKNCLAEAGAVCTIGSSTSSYSGYGSAGDYIAVAQSKKPSINIYQWGKPQVHFQCHIQEIVTAIATDPMGAFLIAGTMKGWIYCWELSSGELINTFQAHFKAITRISVTKIGAPYCISVSEDGTGRAWELHKILDSAETYKNFGKHSLTPFRSWSAHTLPIKDMVVLDSVTTLRVLTCSLDRTIVLYDVLQAQICLRVSLPQALESLAINSTQDLLCAGSSSGAVFLVDLTSTAIAVTAAHAHVTHHSTSLESRSASSHNEGLPKHTSILEGHTKAVSSLNFSRDNCTLVSASQDGSVRVWNVWTRQCLREYVPLAKYGISNAMLIPVPETLSIGVTRPTYCPVAHLHKYFKGQQSVGAAAGTATSASTNTANSGNGGNGAAVVANTDASSSSLVLGPAFLGRRDTDLSACRVKEVAVVSSGPVSKSPSKARHTPPVTASVTDAVPENDDDLGNISFGVDASEEMEMDEPSGQLVQEDEDFVSFSGTFEVPKKSKIGSRKRKSLQAAEAAEAAALEAASQAVDDAAAEPSIEEVTEEVVVEAEAEEVVTEAEVEVEVKSNKKVKGTKVTKTVKAVAAVAAETEAEPVKEVTKKAAVSKKNGTTVATTAVKDDAVLSAEDFFSPAGKKSKTKASAAEVTVTTETDAGSEEDADRPAKRSVKFSANNEVKLITPHKLPGFTNGIQDKSSSEKSKSGPKVTKKAAGKKK